MIDKLLLISGNDIPLAEAQVTIHQPKLKEIAYMNQTSFWTSCELLGFNKKIFKNKLAQSQQKALERFSNLTLLLTMIKNESSEGKKAYNNFTNILFMLFPGYQINFTNNVINLIHDETQEVYIINDKSFLQLQSIVKEMFWLTKLANEQYDPSGKLAEKIAEQIKQGQKKRAQLGSLNDSDINLLNRYISILAAGKNKSILEIMDYTVYQLMDEYTRFMLLYNNRQWFDLKIAGATGLDEQPDWLKDIHSKNKNN